jgi:hypothetical protein
MAPRARPALSCHSFWEPRSDDDAASEYWPRGGSFAGAPTHRKRNSIKLPSADDGVRPKSSRRSTHQALPEADGHTAQSTRSCAPFTDARTRQADARQLTLRFKPRHSRKVPACGPSGTGNRHFVVPRLGCSLGPGTAKARCERDEPASKALLFSPRFRQRVRAGRPAESCRVGMWRGSGRLGHHCCRLFRLAVP